MLDPAVHGPLGFARPVPRDGYAWWYVDAISDDGRYGLTIIGFIGSVFSPYYARARRRGRGDPANHVAMNVVLTGPRGGRWCMTERRTAALAVTPDTLAIGPSAMTWDGQGLTVEIAEWAVPLPRRVCGTVRVRPAAITAASPVLDRDGRHRWWPIAPLSRVEVELTEPALRWSGTGYLDSNHGAEPMERAFTHWDWCRGVLPGTGSGARGDRAVILYNPSWRGAGERADGGHDGTGRAIALTVDAQGRVDPVDPPPRAGLPPCFWWRVARETRCDADAGSSNGARVRETLVDAPFYARSVIDTWLLGQPVTAMHESLDLDRFDTAWVQALLPFRMPRV
ncbi:MAG: hypothetical protein RLY86_1732 [Pseudomonadota bacterium]